MQSDLSVTSDLSIKCFLDRSINAGVDYYHVTLQTAEIEDLKENKFSEAIILVHKYFCQILLYLYG